MNTQPCGICGGQVIVATSSSTGRRVLVDPAVDANGNIQLRPGAAGTIVATALGVAARFGRTQLHVVHVCRRSR